MASAELARLYRIRTIRQNFERVAKQNEGIRKKAKAESNKIKTHFESKAAETNTKIDKHIEKICLKERCLPFGIVMLLICSILLIGTFSFFNPYLSFDWEAVITAHDNAIKNNNDLLPSGLKFVYEKAFLTEPSFMLTEAKIEEYRQEYYDWVVSESYTCLLGNAILFTIVHAILFFGALIKKKSEYLSYPIIPILIFDLVILIVFFSQATGCVGFFNALIGGLLATIGAIPFFFYAGYAFWTIPTAIVVVCYVFTLICEKECAKLTEWSMKNDPVAIELIKEKNEYLRKSKVNSKAAHDKIVATEKDNPYLEEYQGIYESYLKNGSELYDIIWALENRYARDIVEARQFLDQRKRDKAIQDQLSRNADAMYAQAKAQMAQAQATQALANRPVEVNVEVREYYY